MKKEMKACLSLCFSSFVSSFNGAAKHLVRTDTLLNRMIFPRQEVKIAKTFWELDLHISEYTTLLEIEKKTKQATPRSL